MFVFGVVATKGGVGKTTIAANLGGLLADIGYRVLLIDADVQPSLSRYFALSHVAEQGLTQMVMSGVLTPDCISHVELPPASFLGDQSRLNVQGGFIHIVTSDTRDGKLQDWLSNRLDRLVRIRMAIKSLAQDDVYDVAIIDTQGAVGHLQDAAVNASDLLITPASPDIVSAREFVDGTLTLLDRHESSANMGFTVPSMKAVINRVENTVDSRTMAGLIRDPRITAGALRGVQAAPNVPVPPAESAPEATAAAAGLPGAVTQQLSAASPQLADAGVAPAPTPRTTPPHLPQQAPLAGMLAPVAAPDMPPQINPDDPAAHALAQAPAQHRSEAQQIEAIRTAIGRIDALVPLSDVLLSTDEMPFGYLVDLPPESLRLYGDQPAQLPGLRASLWRLLVALSCQCDVRLTKRLPADQVAWAGAYQQGKEVFEQELWQRTGTRFAGLMPAMGMDELSVVLTAPQLGEVVIQLLQAMEELRRRFPTRIPEQIKPLFSSGEG